MCKLTVADNLSHSLTPFLPLLSLSLSHTYSPHVCSCFYTTFILIHFYRPVECKYILHTPAHPPPPPTHTHTHTRILPLNSSTQLCTVSGGFVSLMCLSASSSSTSPVGEELLQTTLRERRPRRLMPLFSNSTRPLRPSSTIIQPRRPEEIQSFQNDVYP